LASGDYLEGQDASQRYLRISTVATLIVNVSQLASILRTFDRRPLRLERRRSSQVRLPLLAAAVIASLIAGCGGSSDRSTEIASATGAASCAATDYELQNRIDRSKARIYNCWIGGIEKCVTEQNGIDQDVTTEAKLLFSTQLSAGAPDCATT
jgi:hypothetical protein